MSDKSGAGAISLPKGGGAVSGLGEKFSPDLFTGTGNFSVPLALPAGRNGFQPELTLGYSTGAGNSAFGLGWNLGVPGVMRKTSKGIPRYDDEQDVFILSGAEDLVPIGRTDLFSAARPPERIGSKTQYRPRTEGLFARIEHYQYLDGRNYWQVWSKDGLVSYYGAEAEPVTTPDHRANPGNHAIIADPLYPARVFGWHLTRTVDPFGNEIIYRYHRETVTAGPHQYEQTYLRDIRYGDYRAPNGRGGEPPQRYLLSVEFTYSATRPDPFSTYESGFERRTTRRCVRVQTYTHPETADLPAGHAAGTDPLAAAEPARNGNRVAVKTYALGYADQHPEAAQAQNAVSLLHQVQVLGHDAGRPAGEQTEAMPPLQFGYSSFAPDLQRFAPVGGELPATSLADDNLELISIFGNGLPDLVQLGGAAPRYWRNLGGGRFDQPRPMREAPGGLQLADPAVQFIDANGDGKPDLLVSRDGLAGYFPLNQNGQWDRQSFRKYKQQPSFSLADPEVRLLDLDGDGVTDVLRNGSRFEYFYHDPEQGFVAGPQVARRELGAFPSVSFQDARVRVAHLCSGLQCIAMVHSGRVEYWPNLGRGRWGQRLTMRNSPVLPRGYNPAHVLLGDVDGDGLDDFIYVQNNKITLWLNQSGNSWSAPIEITGTPPITDASAVRITDLLGTGVAGVLWTRDAQAVGRAQQYLFLDLTGRVKPYVLNQMDNQLGALTRVGYAPSTAYYLADQKKPATRWQTPLPFPVQVVSHVEVIDRLSGGKMTTEYAYHHGYWDGGEREFRGFGRVDQRDTQTFEQYHRDGLFADDPSVPLVRVPGQFESEDFTTDFVVDEIVVPPRVGLTSPSIGTTITGDWTAADFAGADFLLSRTVAGPPALAGGVLPVAAGYFAPPLETRTWFHLGPVGDGTGEWRELDLTGEYWAGDPSLLSRPAGMLDLLRGLPRRQRRDAIRTLRGSTLRTELYARDGSARQDRPYTVTESLTGLAQVRGLAPVVAGLVDTWLVFDGASEAPAGRRGAAFRSPQPIFFAHGRAQRTTQWERGDDPMTQFSFTADYDAYGQARRQLSVALPRGWDRATALATNALVSYSVSQHAGYEEGPQRNAYDSAGQYLVDRTVSSTSWELLTETTTLSVFDLLADAQTEATQAKVGRKLLGHSLQYYDGDAFQGREFGRLGAYGALTRSEVLILTPESIAEAYGPDVPLLLQPGQPSPWPAEYPAAFQRAYAEAYPSGAAGYHLGSTAEYVPGGYYQVAERRQYDFQLATPPARRYGLVVALLDALGTAAGATGTRPQRVSRVAYDAYALLPVQTTDALGHQTTARYDYRLLQARLVTDPNLNRTAYGHSPLGLLRETALLGKFGAGEGDVKTEAASAGLVPDYQASTYLEYDFFAFARLGQPAWVRTTQREQHYAVSAQSDMLVKAEYSDGFGRLLQTRAQAEETLFGEVSFGDSGLPADPTATNKPALGRRNTDPVKVNVVVSGWQVYDNKGRVVEKYEPFFSTGFDFVLADAAARGQRVRMFYDPRGQVIRTLNPDGAEQSTIFGKPSAAGLGALEAFEPTPWESFSYDANDLADLTHPGQNRANAAHVYTPQSAEVDALGRVVRTVDRLGSTAPTGTPSEVEMAYAYDLTSNRVRITDAFRRTAFSHSYDLKGNVLATQHLDGGQRISIFDGAGQPLQGTDAKGSLTLHAYDALERPAGAWARDRAAEMVRQRQHFVYGNDSALNNKGQLTEHYDEAGRQQFLGYDFKGNLLEKSWQVVADEVFTSQWGIAAGTGWGALPGGFNAHWDDLSTAATRLAPRRYETSSSYDALNRATRLTLPAEPGRQEARPVLLPSYNRAGALSQVRLDGQVLVQQLAYNARGQRLLLARGNGLMTRYTYDAVSFRLRRLRTEKYTASGQTFTPLSGSTHQDTSYTYDLAGNITATAERAPQSGVAGAGQLDRLFTYDALYRLLSASGRENQPTPGRPWQDSTRSEGAASTTGYTQQYTYDLLGNIQQLRHTGASGFTRQFQYTAPTNRLQAMQAGADTISYQYDAVGNVTQEDATRHFQWDASDQLRQFATWTGAGTVPTLLAYYLYDAGGQRAKKITQTATGVYQVTVYAAQGLEYRYEVSAGTSTAVQTRLRVLDGTSCLYQRRSGPDLGDLRPAELYFLEDHLGSATGTVDGSGGVVGREEYYPFGETSFGAHEKHRYRFCGKERDQESGLYYYGMRYYAPWLCRFVSVDPLAAKYAYYTPYQYAGNKPIIAVDIDGLEADKDTGQQAPVGSPTNPVQLGGVTVTGPKTPQVDQTPGSSMGRAALIGAPVAGAGAVLAAELATAASTGAGASAASGPGAPVGLIITAVVLVVIIISFAIEYRAAKRASQKDRKDALKPYNDELMSTGRITTDPAIIAPETTTDKRAGRQDLKWITYTWQIKAGTKYTFTKGPRKGETIDIGGRIYSGRTAGPADVDASKIVLSERYGSGRDKDKFASFAPGSLNIDREKVGPEGYLAIRGREQQLIDFYKGAISDNGTSGNPIRGVGKDNPAGRIFHFFSNKNFGPKAGYTGN
ncbi:SpvB/TcaC N-terminal domain-containing protein [uncultured Hymenobacter sp.]|uniref:SpvB/TcaC N-terminal domain-containing protein n=1 Tax=uncultured Hymenobacter sp. TaxID=170016 RepID=UPI0035CA4CBC